MRDPSETDAYSRSEFGTHALGDMSGKPDATPNYDRVSMSPGGLPNFASFAVVRPSVPRSYTQP